MFYQSQNQESAFHSKLHTYTCSGIIGYFICAPNNSFTLVVAPFKSLFYIYCTSNTPAPAESFLSAPNHRTRAGGTINSYPFARTMRNTYRHHQYQPLRIEQRTLRLLNHFSLRAELSQARFIKNNFYITHS